MIKILVVFLTILFSFNCTAQVAVKDEPHHHNVFENQYVRLLDVHIGPGDTTLYHEHKTPSVFFTFTKTVTTSQLFGNAPSRSSNNRPGPPSYDSLGTPRIHRVWNNDSVWFQVMDIELLTGKPSGNPPVLQLPNLTLSFNRYLANGYRMEMKGLDEISLPKSSIGYLIVSQENAEIEYKIGDTSQMRSMKPGHFIWIPKDQTFSMKNMVNASMFMLLQLK